MSYIPRMRESSAGWLGQGQILYSTSGHANNPFADSPALQQLQKPYKDAQIQRRAAQAADKAARQAGRQGHVTVYDAVKRQYVSATPQEAVLIREANKGIQAQRRAAQAAKALGTGNVTVFDASKGIHVSATPQEAKLIKRANKRMAAADGLNERITSHMGNKSYYGGKTVKSGNQFISISPEQVKAQVQRRASQAPKTLGTGNVTVFDASKGLHVSATPQEAKLIEQANKALSTPAIGAGADLTSAGAGNAAGAGASTAGTGVLTAGAGNASGAAATANTPAIVNNAQNGTTKTGFLSKIKNGVSNLFSKAKNALSAGLSKAKAFIKTPKGKWSLAIAAVIVAGTALFAYVANRFSDKNKPTPTNGPDKIFMPKLEEKPAAVEDDEDVDNTDDNEKTEADKANEAKAAAEAEKKEADKAAEANKDKREPEKVSGDEYEVIEGDCVWNIAKAHLKELNSDVDDYTPTNVDILRHTKELMEINDLHYEADNYVVIIQPGQKIKLKKSE